MRIRPLVAQLAGTGVGVAGLVTTRAAVERGVQGVQAAEQAAHADHADHCPHDNLLRCLIGTPTLAYTFCSWSVGIYPTPVTVYTTVTVAPAVPSV